MKNIWKIRPTIAACILGIMVTPGAAQDMAEGAKAWLSGELKPPQLSIDYDGEPITMRFSSFLSPSVKLVSDVWVPAIARLEAESGGKIKVKPYWGGTLHGLREGFKAVREGVTDFTHCMTALDPGHFDIFSGLTIPFLFEDSAVATMVSQAVYPKYLKKEYETQGVLLAHITMTPPYNILTKEPVKRLEDLSGKKLRIGGGLQSEIIAALGAVPLNISSRELYTAFQTGVIDGVAFHDAALVSFRASEVGKYKTRIELLSNSSEYCLGRQFYEKLPTTLKPVLARWMQELAVAEAQIFYDGFGEAALDSMNKAGIKVLDLSDEEQKKWTDATSAVVEQYIENMKGKGHEVGAMLTDMKLHAEKYAAMSSMERMQSVMENPVSGILPE